MHGRRALMVLVLFGLSGLPAAITQTTADEPVPAYPQVSFDAARVCAVVDVSDALSIVVQRASRETRVKLLGVAIPADEAARMVARDALQRMLLGELVYVQADATAGGESSAAYLYRAPDGLLVNLELVRGGYARAAVEPHAHSDLFRHYEQIARRHDKGVWSDAPRDDPRLARQLAPSKANAASQLGADDTVVYVTRTGAKYHRQDCPHAQKSGRPMALREAAQRYGPCSRCDPPVSDD